MIATVSPPTSANVGTQVTVSGSATGCPNPRYEFWLLPPGGTWAIAQGYSGASSFTWSTIGKRAGSYRFSVWARDASSLASYDAFSAFDYPLTTAPCTGIGASTNPVNTASRGTDVTVTGAATGCPNPRFEIWLLPPSGTWTLLRGWTSSPSTVWHTTAGTAAGTYRFSVWARDLSSAGTSGTVPNKYDSFSAFPYSLS